MNIFQFNYYLWLVIALTGIIWKHDIALTVGVINSAVWAAAGELDRKARERHGK